MGKNSRGQYQTAEIKDIHSVSLCIRESNYIKVKNAEIKHPSSLTSALERYHKGRRWKINDVAFYQQLKSHLGP